VRVRGIRHIVWVDIAVVGRVGALLDQI
jgi:hypothetical protein